MKLRLKLLASRMSIARLLTGALVLTALCYGYSLAQPQIQLPVWRSSLAGSLAPRTDDEQRMIDVYRRANKSVVHINTQTSEFDFFGVQQQEGAGSGVIIDAKQGLIATNF